MGLERAEIQLDKSAFEYEDIMKCLTHLYSTPAGTYPVNRDFGIDPNIIDMPLSTSKTLLCVEFIKKTEAYEPRVEVTDVSFFENVETGELHPLVKVRRKEMDEEMIYEDDNLEDGEDDE